MWYWQWSSKTHVLTNRSDFTCGCKDMGPEHNSTSSDLVNQVMMPRLKLLSRPKKLNAVSTKVLLQFFPRVWPLPDSYVLKQIWWYPAMFCTHNFSCEECFKGHKTCQWHVAYPCDITLNSEHVQNRYNMDPKCDLVSQGKNKWGKGQTAGKNRSSTFWTDCIQFLWQV